MAGKLTHNLCFRYDLFHKIEHGNSDISCQNRIVSCMFEQMIQQRGNRTLSLGARDTGNLIAEAPEKHLCLGKDLTAVILHRLFQYHSGTFENHIIIIQTALVIRPADPFSNPFRQLPGRRLIRDIHGLKGSQTPQHLPCGFPLSSKAQQKYLFPPYPGINFLYHSPSPRLLCFLCTPFPDKFFPGFRHQIAAVKISGKLIFLRLIPLIQACFFIMFK